MGISSNFSAMDALNGFFSAQQYIGSRRAAIEVKQGGNYYFILPFRYFQISSLMSVVSELSKCRTQPLGTFARLTVSWLPLASLPINYFLANVRTGQYGGILPERVIRGCNFLADNQEHVIRLAMVVGSLALVVLGSSPFAYSVLFSEGIEFVSPWLPNSVRVLYEGYLPIVSVVGLFFIGSIGQKIASAINLVLIVKVPESVYFKVDNLYRRVIPRSTPALSEFYAPVVEQRNMSFEEINHILDNPQDYEINPAHCTKPVVSRDHLPKDSDFAKLMTYFDSVKWEEMYRITKTKISNDERYINFLVVKFPNVTQDELKEHTETYTIQLAEKEGITKEKFTANWIRAQMQHFIAKLQGVEELEGPQIYLDGARKNSEHILAFMPQLKEKCRVDWENVLLMMAVDGGNYCGLRVWDVSEKILDAYVDADTDTDKTPDGIFEKAIRRSLHSMRSQLVQGLVQKALSIYPETVGSDKHVGETFIDLLSRGFNYQPGRVNILTDLLFWELHLSRIQVEIYKEYGEIIDNAISEIGNDEFIAYLERSFNGNTKLSAAQRDDLWGKYASWNYDAWSGEDTDRMFHNILFVQLGILRRKKTSA